MLDAFNILGSEDNTEEVILGSEDNTEEVIRAVILEQEALDKLSYHAVLVALQKRMQVQSLSPAQREKLKAALEEYHTQAQVAFDPIGIYERQALCRLYAATGGEEWKQSSNW